MPWSLRIGRRSRVWDRLLSRTAIAHRRHDERLFPSPCRTKLSITLPQVRYFPLWVQMCRKAMVVTVQKRWRDEGTSSGGGTCGSREGAASEEWG